MIVYDISIGFCRSVYISPQESVGVFIYWLRLYGAVRLPHWTWRRGWFGEPKYCAKIYIDPTLSRFLLKKSSLHIRTNRLDHLDWSNLQRVRLLLTAACWILEFSQKICSFHGDSGRLGKNQSVSIGSGRCELVIPRSEPLPSTGDSREQLGH